MVELKPCPFCGGDAAIHSSGNVWPKEYFRVLCKKVCCTQAKFFDTPEEASEAWNRRKNELDSSDKLKPKAIKWPLESVNIHRAQISKLSPFDLDISRMRIDGTIEGNFGVVTHVDRFIARVIDMQDQAVYDAAIRAASEAGIDTLYLMDKQFVIDALREKLERDYHGKY